MSEVRTKAVDEKFCETCGEIIKAAAEICPKCGVRQKKAQSAGSGEKTRMSFILFGLFLGGFGAHNFYAGYTVKAIIQLALTLLSLIAAANDVPPVWLVIVSIWVIVELIVVKTDSDGNALA